MAKTVLEELLVGLGYDYDDKDVQQFISDVDTLKDTISGLIKVAVSGATALTGIAVASTAATDEQGKLAKEIGISIGELSALEFATDRAGGSADGLRGELVGLAAKMAEAREGVGAGVEIFGRLGISMYNANGSAKSVTQTLHDVSRTIQGLSRQQQISFTDQLGLADTRKLLQEGSVEMANLTARAKQLGVATDEDAQIAAEFQDTLVDFWRIIKQISRTLTREFTPILIKINSAITEWWVANRKFIEQNLDKYLMDIYRALKLAGAAMLTFVGYKTLTSIGTLIVGLRKISFASLFMAASLAAIPALVTAIIAALILLTEDAKGFFDGKDSFIGEMLERFPEFRDELSTTASIFATLSSVTSTILDGWRMIFEIFDNFTTDKLKEFGSNLPGFLGEVTGLHTLGGDGVLQQAGISDAVSSTASTVIDKVEILIDGGADSAGAIADAIYEKFRQVGDNFSTPVRQ